MAGTAQQQARDKHPDHQKRQDLFGEIPALIGPFTVFRARKCDQHHTANSDGKGKLRRIWHDQGGKDDQPGQ